MVNRRWRLFVRATYPQYKGIEADPLMYPPPYIQTITGRCSRAVLAGVQMLSKGNLRSLPEVSRPAWRLQLACTPEQTHLPYGCQSTVRHGTGHWRGSEMGFLCRHSPHLRVSPIRCRTPIEDLLRDNGARQLCRR